MAEAPAPPMAGPDEGYAGSGSAHAASTRVWLLSGRGSYEAGVLATPIALAPAFLLAALLAVPTPVEPLAEALMQLTPLPLANALLNLLGDAARLAALLGALAITLPVGGVLGLVAPEDGAQPRRGPRRFSRWAAVTALALLAVLPLARAAQDGAQAACALLAGAAYTPALLLARVGWRRILREPAAASRTGLSRRGLLRGLLTSGATVAGALALGSFDLWSGALGSLVGRGELPSRVLFLFSPRAPRAAGFPVAGEEPEVTPLGHFYLLSKNAVDPLIEPAAWRLAVRGAVGTPLLLTYDALFARPRTDAYVTLRCVNNPPSGRLMSTALWSGVPLAALLAEAQMRPGARSLALHAADAYDEVIPLAAALAPGALVAYGMNGETLPRRHGGPVRALVPGYYGFKNVKWLTGISVLTTDAPGYWAQRGWTAGQVHPVARVDTWQQVPVGALVAGVAFTGTRGVSAVEVRADGDDWQRAELSQPALSDACWVQWRAILALAPGIHTIRARVVDGAGTPQEEAVTDPHPDGATGLDTQEVRI